MKKCDPVARYHEFKTLWELVKPPGERPRNALRWQIRVSQAARPLKYSELSIPVLAGLVKESESVSANARISFSLCMCVVQAYTIYHSIN